VKNAEDDRKLRIEALLKQQREMEQQKEDIEDELSEIHKSLEELYEPERANLSKEIKEQFPEIPEDAWAFYENGLLAAYYNLLTVYKDSPNDYRVEFKGYMYQGYTIKDALLSVRQTVSYKLNEAQKDYDLLSTLINAHKPSKDTDISTT
jgi:hypothetical protein